MKTSTRPTIIALTTFGIGGGGLFGLLAADGEAQAPPPDMPPEASAARTGLPGSMHFTDERGNPRNPTAAEARAAAQAFRKDLERLAGPHSGRTNERSLPGGGVAATVATSKLALLYAVENENGTLTIGHSESDGGGDIARRPANQLPEK